MKIIYIKQIIKEEVVKNINEFNNSLDAEDAIKFLDNEPKYGISNINVDENNDIIEITFHELTKSYLNHINIVMDSLGWYPYTLPNDDKYDEKKLEKYYWNNQYNLSNKNLKISYAKKYDKEIKANTKFLYHATNDLHIDKIKKYGLHPKSKNEMATYPNRIYLTKTYDYAEDIAINPFGGLWTKLNDKKGHHKQKIATKMYILKIDISKIPNIKLYKDNFYSGGFYTQNAIPPSAIKVVKMFDLDKPPFTN